MDRKKVANVLDVLAGHGNVAFLFGHIDYFEKAIPAEIAPFIELAGALNAENWACQECHNFSAWIRLYSELVCNKAMTKLSHNELFENAPADFVFGELARVIIEKAAVIAEEKGIARERIEAMPGQ